MTSYLITGHLTPTSGAIDAKHRLRREEIRRKKMTSYLITGHLTPTSGAIDVPIDSRREEIKR